MEKIQAALAKARAARGAGAAAPARGTKGAAAGGGYAGPAAAFAGVSATSAAWSSLRAFRPAPEVFLRNHLIEDGDRREATTFDVMRTRLLQAIRTNGWRRVAITSPSPACGKTTISLNLGLSLARQPELRVILVEADLRRPSMVRMLGLPETAPVSAVLSGEADFGDCALRLADNLAVATNPAGLRNSAEILGQPHAATALERMETVYAPTVTLFDMPPMMTGDDVMAFVDKVDAVLLVAAAEATTIKQIDLCERELAAQTNVMGVVVNKCRFLDPAEGYAYGYGS